MAEYTITIDKNSVYDEVAKTTSYTGTKKKDDDTAYSRIFTTEYDRQMLERFWSESKNAACNSLKKFLVSEQEGNDTYTMTLDLSASFDDALTDSINRSMFSFFVMNITAKWFAISNKPETAEYATYASANMDDVMRKAFYKKKPERPTY